MFLFGFTGDYEEHEERRFEVNIFCCCQQNEKKNVKW